nr:hypothetical protein [Nanoarchaeum sp.]
MNKKTIFLIILILIGVYFLGKGITGFIVSESCCFPPNCLEENLCKNIDYWADTKYISTLIGLIIFISVVFVKMFSKK